MCSGRSQLRASSAVCRDLCESEPDFQQVLQREQGSEGHSDLPHTECQLKFTHTHTQGSNSQSSLLRDGETIPFLCDVIQTFSFYFCIFTRSINLTSISQTTNSSACGCVVSSNAMGMVCPPPSFQTGQGLSFSSILRKRVRW